MMLPSSTYANTSALCWCAGTTSPGERRTVSIRPSFPGTSGRIFVIRDVSFAIWRFGLLEPRDWNSTNARMNNENTYILLIYKLLIRSRGSEATADVLFEFVELAPTLKATLCHFDQDCSNERAGRCWDLGALLYPRAPNREVQSHPRPLCSARSE